MDNLSETSMNPLKIWWLAIRPRTLPAAMSGVITGSALALSVGKFHPLPALAAMLVALLLQIGSNLANDVFDFERGADAGPRLGPLRVTQSELLTPRQVKTGMLVVFTLAGLLGIYLAFAAGWVVLPIGLAAMLAAVAYTAGPYPLGYHGLGELFVFLFFGVASVAGTYFVQAGSVSAAAWAMSVPLGSLIVGILVVNNLRDLDSDHLAGKHTLAARFGARFAKTEYIVCLALAYLCIPVYCAFGLLPWPALFTWLSLPLAVSAARIVLTKKGRPLNQALGQTGLVALLFSLLFLAQELIYKLAFTQNSIF